MATNAELKRARLARQKKKKEAREGKSLGTESFTVTPGKMGKSGYPGGQRFTYRKSDEGMTDYVAKGKLRKGVDVERIMEAEGKHQMKKRKRWLEPSKVKRKKPVKGILEKQGFVTPSGAGGSGY